MKRLFQYCQSGLYPSLPIQLVVLSKEMRKNAYKDIFRYKRHCCCQLVFVKTHAATVDERYKITLKYVFFKVRQILLLPIQFAIIIISYISIVFLSVVAQPVLSRGERSHNNIYTVMRDDNSHFVFLDGRCLFSCYCACVLQ